MTKVLQTEREDAFFHFGKRTDSLQKRRGILTVENTRSCARQRGGHALWHIRGFPCPPRNYNCVTHGFCLEQISAESEESFALCSFETGLRASSRHARRWSLEPCLQTILASDAVQRLFGKTLVIGIPRATIVNHGQIDGRRVWSRSTRSVLFIPRSAFRAS